MRRLALAGLLAAAALPGLGTASDYFPPPGDCCVQWSPNGTQLVFSGNRGGGNEVGVVGANGGAEQFVRGIPIGLRSPDWRYVAYTKEVGSARPLVVSNVGGSDEHLLAAVSSFGEYAWAPNSQRLAVSTSDGLVVAWADGRASAWIVPGPVAWPVWSPSGDRIAYVTGSDPAAVSVVDPDGGSKVTFRARPAGSAAAPVWSPDGGRLAFFSRVRGTVAVTIVGTASRTITYAAPGTEPTGTLLWPRPGRTIYATGEKGLIAIDLRTGKERTLAGIGNAASSPDGSRLAYAAGGECRDRVGIYVANADGTNRRRLTNRCTVTGTSGPDVLHGSFSQVVLGLGGNDTLYADDTYYFFDGNTLYGGPGNDLLYGGFGQDDLYGGPGDDILSGGPSADVLVGGPGQDRIYGGGGGDTIYAADGERDWIDCGRNGYGKGGRDVVYADRYDDVGRSCEIVHRART